MTIDAGKHHKFHMFLFALLSWHLFLFTPIEFIHIALAGIICISVMLHLKNIKFVFNSRMEIVLFAAVNFYLTFAIFGFDLFMMVTLLPGRVRDAVFPGSGSVLWVNLNYDINMPDNNLALNLYRFLFFLLGFIWTAYVLQSALDLMKFLGGKAELLQNLRKTDILAGKKYWPKWLILVVIMISLFMVWQRAYVIAMIAMDSWVYLHGWLHNEFWSFRSPVYTFLLSVIARLAPTHPEVHWIVFTKIFAFSSLLASILMYFHMKGIRYRYIIAIAGILPLIPSLGLQPLAILPDLANAMSMLWLTYVLVRIIDEVIMRPSAGRIQKISFCVQLCISMILVFFMRTNSFPVFIVMTPVLALFFLLRKQWKFFTTIFITVALVLLIRYPGFNALDVKFEEEGQAVYIARFFAGLHDIKAAYLAGGTFSEETLEMLYKLVPTIDHPDFIFIPDYVLKWFGPHINELTTRQFLSMYMDSLRNNPVEMIRSVLFRIRSYWVIDPKSTINTVNFTVIFGDDHFTEFANIFHSQAPRIGVERPNNLLTVMMNEYIWFMNKSIPATFIWRFGVWSALMVISVMTLLLQKKYLWLLVYLPVFVYFCTLVLVGGWPDHRYGLPVFYIGMFLPPVLVLLNPSIAINETKTEET